MTDVVDLHTHTIASGHAYNTIYEMARSASEKGVQLLGISDHAPAMEGSASRHYFRSSRCIPRELFGIRLLFGCELNIIDLEGNVDLEPAFTAPLDFAVASMHDVCLTPGTLEENTRAYLNVMENDKVNIIGHPDDGLYPVDFDVLAQAASEHGVLLELNEASIRPDSYRKDTRHNAIRMLECCVKYGARIIVSSDAHAECDILKHTSALALLRETGFPEELVVNRSAELAIAALHEKRCGQRV